MGATGGDGPRISVSLAWTILVAAVTGVVSALTAGYGARDAALRQAREMQEATRTAIVSQYQEDMRHYVTLEQFLEYRREERSRQDGQYYAVLSAIQRLDARLRK